MWKHGKPNSREELTVAEPAKAGESARLAIMTNEVVPKRHVHTLVEQDPR
jgi:hypothetical protein